MSNFKPPIADRTRIITDCWWQKKWNSIAGAKKTSINPEGDIFNVLVNSHI